MSPLVGKAINDAIELHGIYLVYAALSGDLKLATPASVSINEPPVHCGRTKCFLTVITLEAVIPVL